MVQVRSLLVLSLAVAWLAGAAVAHGHEMTVKGTVASIEASRVQVKTGEEKRDQAPAWFAIEPTTKIRRGDKTVTLDEARIRTGERIVILVDHKDDGTMKALEVRLAP